MAVIRTMSGAGCAIGTRKRGIGIPVMTAIRGVEAAGAAGTVAEATGTVAEATGTVVEATGTVAEAGGTDRRRVGVRVAMDPAVLNSVRCGIARPSDKFWQFNLTRCVPT
jgi:hypothetical protein